MKKQKFLLIPVMALACLTLFTACHKTPDTDQPDTTPPAVTQPEDRMTEQNPGAPTMEQTPQSQPSTVPDSASDPTNSPAIDPAPVTEPGAMQQGAQSISKPAAMEEKSQPAPEQKADPADEHTATKEDVTATQPANTTPKQQTTPSSSAAVTPTPGLPQSFLSQDLPKTITDPSLTPPEPLAGSPVTTLAQNQDVAGKIITTQVPLAAAPADTATTEPTSQPAAATEVASTDTSMQANDTLAQELLADINAKRVDAGLPEYTADATLSEIALQYANTLYTAGSDFRTTTDFHTLPSGEPVSSLVTDTYPGSISDMGYSVWYNNHGSGDEGFTSLQDYMQGTDLYQQRALADFDKIGLACATIDNDGDPYTVVVMMFVTD